LELLSGLCAFFAAFAFKKEAEVIENQPFDFAQGPENAKINLSHIPGNKRLTDYRLPITDYPTEYPG
jgi:hypothetical protein